MFYLIIVAVLFFALGYYLAKYNKEDEVTFNYPEKSELSDPTVNIPPYWFYKCHYDLLKNMNSFDMWWTFFTSWQLNNWDKSNARRASELAKMWFLNVRSEKTFRGKRNYYSLNSKGKSALLQFNNKF